MPKLDSDLVSRVLDGDQDAVLAFVEQLTPLIHKQVGYYLLRRGRQAGRDIRQEVEDLTQEVFLALFADDCRALRKWRPDGGRSLPTFIRAFVQFRVASIFRTDRTNPWHDSPTEEGVLELRLVQAWSPVQGMDVREYLAQLMRRMEEALSPEECLLFRQLFLEERPVEEIAVEKGVTPDVIHKRKSRLIARMRQLREEIEKNRQDLSDPGPEVRIGTRGRSP